jgi:hypothetical protein
VESRGCCSEDANDHKHPDLKASSQHQRQSEDRSQAVDEVGRDHDPLAVVAIGPSARQWTAKHERDREAEIKSGEGKGEFGLLLRHGIEHLCQIHVQRKSRHAAANDGQRLGSPNNHERAEPVRGRRVGHLCARSWPTRCRNRRSTDLP